MPETSTWYSNIPVIDSMLNLSCSVSSRVHIYRNLEGIFFHSFNICYMALDMANRDASSATVKVLVWFYLGPTDQSSSRARSSAIHKEKFNVPLSVDEPIDLSNVVKHLKTFNELAEIAKSEDLGEKPEVVIFISWVFIIPGYKKLVFCRNL